MTLCELSLIKSNHIYAEIKYKSESNAKEIEFENLMAMLLSEEEVKGDIELACR